MLDENKIAPTTPVFDIQIMHSDYRIWFIYLIFLRYIET